MTPFQSLRLWSRRAPTGQRVGAVLGVALALAVIGWLLAPASTRSTPAYNSSGAGGIAGAATNSGGQIANPGGSTATGGATSGRAAFGATTGQAGGASGPGAAGAPVATSAGNGSGGAGGGSSGGAAGSPAGGKCVTPPGSDVGVTSSEIKVAITVTDIVGPTANTAFGVPTPQETENDFNYVINSVNASGGVACRKLVPEFFTANTSDQTDLQQKCFEIAQAGVFMELDTGGYYAYPALASCYAQHGVPFLGPDWLYNSEVSQYYPYLFGEGSLEVLYRNTVFALKQRGFFNTGDFTKLGIVYQDCIPQLIGEFEGWLNQVGVPQSKVVTFDDGCPDPFASPGELEQAILKFQQNNVHDVTFLNDTADFANFTTIAEQQNFHPHYGIGDDAILAISKSSQHADYNNVANAIAITADRYGEEDTPGMAFSAGTNKCDAIYASHGQPPVYQRPEDGVGYSGWACNEIWELVAAVDHAPALRRTAVAAGLQASGGIDFSYPYGPANFSGAGVTYGAQFWRTAQFFTSCDCWRVIDPSFHPGFS